MDSNDSVRPQESYPLALPSPEMVGISNTSAPHLDAKERVSHFLTNEVFMKTNTVQATKPLLAVHLPDWSKGNPYQQLLADAITRNNWQVILHDYDKSPFSLQRTLAKYPDARILHLHWIAPLTSEMIWSKQVPVYWLRLGLLVLDLLICKLRRRKIVWTVHNKLSHESANPKRERTTRRLLSNIVDHMIFHSLSARRSFDEDVSITKDGHASIIPHGNYIGIYEASTEVEERLVRQLRIDDKCTVILFFGKLRAYKGVEQLIRAFSKAPNPNLRLIVAGKPANPQASSEIETAANEDPRIISYLGFVPEEEVAPLHRLAHVIAIPFEQTLTSGSVILAMSLGKPLLLPETAKVLDIVDEHSALLFSDQEQLVEHLNNLPRLDLQEMGLRNISTARTLDWDDIGRKVAAVYEKQ